MVTLGMTEQEVQRNQKMIKSSMLAKWLVNFEVIDIVGEICQNPVEDTTFSVRWFVHELDEIRTCRIQGVTERIWKAWGAS